MSYKIYEIKKDYSVIFKALNLGIFRIFYSFIYLFEKIGVIEHKILISINVGLIKN